MKLLKKIETISPQNCMKKSSGGSSAKKFNWTSSSIKWYLDAQEITGFYEKAIEVMQPYIKNSKTVIDIGCGIGTFSIELARKGLKVTAIDRSSKVIEVLKKRIESGHISNINVFNEEFEYISDKENYDIVLMSYMMGTVNGNNIQKILNLSNEYVVLILPVDEKKDNFSIMQLYKKIGTDIEELKQHAYKELLETLNKLEIKYDLKLFESEFGQLFYSKEEAVNFIQHYFKIPISNKIQLMKWLEEKLVEKNGKYYLPNKRRCAMVIIKK